MILLAIEKQMNLLFVSTVPTTVYNLLLFIFILFCFFMKIKGSFNQQFCWLGIMIIPKRDHLKIIFYEMAKEKSHKDGEICKTLL